MIKVNIETLLLEKGRTKYWLSKTTGISQNNLAKLASNDTRSILFENLEKICDALGCEIQNILTIVKDEKTVD